MDTMQKVCGLVEWHDDNPNLTPAGIRKAIYRVGEERYPDLFALKRADVLSQSGYRREEKIAYIQSYQKLYEEIIEQKDCLSLKKTCCQRQGSDGVRDQTGEKKSVDLTETIRRSLRRTG